MTKKMFVWGLSACLLGLPLVVSPAPSMAQMPACTAANIAGKYSGVVAGGDLFGGSLSAYAFLHILGNGQLAFVAYFSQGGSPGQVLFVTGSASIINTTSCLTVGSLSALPVTQIVARFVPVDNAYNIIFVSTPFDNEILLAGVLFRDASF